ncbi:MAG: hypothetical protein N2049_02035 [Anaerolineales bacterium]|nr:hypothetical protein [Anaerolineales bacterium]
MKPSKRTLSLKERGFDFETFMWFYTRISALAMYLFGFVALLGAMVMGARLHMTLADVIRWSFMPTLYHVQNTDIPAIEPWVSLFWKLTASLFVLFAAGHGLHGLLSVIEDYMTIPWLRRTFRMVVLALWVGVSYIGIYLIWTAA